MDEVNIDSIDLGDEHRQGIEACLYLPPIIVGAPVANSLLEFCKLWTLRPVVDRFLVRPADRRKTPAQIDKVCLRNLDGERADRLLFAGGATGMRGKQADDRDN